MSGNNISVHGSVDRNVSDPTNRDYNLQYNLPSVEGHILKGDTKLSDIGIPYVFYATCEEWNAQPQLVTVQNAIYVYTDYQVDEQGKNIAGIKIGDGETLLYYSPFINTSSGSGGTNNYNALANRPIVNGKVVEGNHGGDYYELVNKGDMLITQLNPTDPGGINYPRLERVKTNDGTIYTMEYSPFAGTDGTHFGTSGLVPSPTIASANKFLKSSGGWVMPSAEEISYSGTIDGVEVSTVKEALDKIIEIISQ